ncbi:hypothetical protein BofuT4_uP025810.1 [Botrytis cinerea T4]|uniref:Uncharacterized protein n=1 Tax=Botryotinia fuckeliana (strain T4) TaxID=999810 RepID=G2YEI4_BOTF4|nr:hypothetical protein BofuT4_uP025810.1 [Botrytis cinerea T4]
MAEPLVISLASILTLILDPEPRVFPRWRGEVRGLT